MLGLCVTFVLASLLSLMLLLNLTVGFGLTGGAGAIPLLRVILILNCCHQELYPADLKEFSEWKFKNGGFAV